MTSVAPSPSNDASKKSFSRPQPITVSNSTLSANSSNISSKSKKGSAKQKVNAKLPSVVDIYFLGEFI